MPPTLHSKHDPAHAHTPWETIEPTAIPLIVDPPAGLSLEVTEDDLAGLEPSDSTVSQEREARDDRSSPKAGGGLLTLPLLCLGLGLIACCVLIPATEENRRLAYEKLKLQADLDQITRQIDVNNEFLKRVADDPTLSERLAQRQMKMVREGTSVLELKGRYNGKDMSPFELVTLPPPPELAPYQPVGGKLSAICGNPRSQLYLMGGGLLLVAAGLVLGSGASSEAVKA